MRVRVAAGCREANTKGTHNKAITLRDQRKLSCVAPEPSVHGSPARCFAHLHSRQADGRVEYPAEVEPLVVKKAKSSLYTSIPEGNADGLRCYCRNPKAHHGCPKTTV